MVKYLSDQKNDPYYQTKLSLSQPFESEVAAEMYPVDEVDLTPSLNMIETGARAYYAHQGEELERENMNISFGMYQAGRAKEKAQTAAAEKEKGLKNTMLNDYAIAVSREVLDPYMQGVGGMSPVAAERKLRDIREQYIRMTGGVLNASDLMKIEKDSGVTFTKDLYQADLKNQNEIYKEQRADNKNQVKALYKRDHPSADVASIPYSEMAQYASQLAEFENGAIVGAQTDAMTIANSDDPNITNGKYISGGTKTSLRNFYQNRFETYRRLGMTQNEYWSSSQLLDFKQLAENELANSEVEVNGVAVKLGEIYSPDIISGVVEDAYIRSGIEKPYTQEQAALEATNKEIEQLNKYYEGRYIKPIELENKLTEQRNIQLINRIAGPAAIFFRGQNPENGLLALQTINEKQFERVKGALNAAMEGNQALGKIDGLSTGESFAAVTKQIGVTDKDGELFLSNVAVDNGKAIVNGTGMYEYKPVTRWDAQMADAAMQNKDTILLNGKEDPSSEAADTKEDNTKVTLELYRKLRSNKEWWDSISREDQEKLTRWYTDGMNSVVYRNLALLNKEGLSENIAYDTASNRFVPINSSDSKGSQKHTTLWKVVDTLNGLTHTGLEEFDESLIKALRNKAEDGEPVIKDLTKTDRLVSESSTINFARALGRGDKKNIIASTPGAFLEGVRNTGEFISEGVKWVGENAVSGAIGLGVFGDEMLEKNGEAVADVVDFITNPDRTIKDEFEKAKNNTLDAFADVVLKGEDMTKEEKQQAKEEFKEQIKAAKDFLTKGELFEDGFGSGIGWEVPGKNTTVNWSMPGKGLLSGLQNILENSSVKWEMPGKKLFSVLKNIFVGRRDLPTIPPYNAGIITRIMQEDETVTPEEANAALTAYNQASTQDKIRLNADFNIGYLDKNVEQRLKEAIKDLKSLKESSKGSSKKPRSIKEEYIPGIL